MFLSATKGSRNLSRLNGLTRLCRLAPVSNCLQMRLKTNESKNNSINNHTLLDEIVQRIKVSGPITVSDYMKMSLTHPQFGFYMNEDVFGSKGHFTTSPEVSQLFGELIGIWILYQWLQCDAKKPLKIVELGPGRGTLCSDISRVISQFRQTNNNVSFHLVEISPFLRKIQEKNICQNLDNETFETIQAYSDNGVYKSETIHGLPITWYSTIDQVPSENSGFTVYVANEFFDAFPVNKFVKVQDDWRELLVDWNPHSSSLCWLQARNATPVTKLFSLLDPSIVDSSDHLEISLPTLTFIDDVVDRINKDDGCLLICDYGHDQAKSKTIVNRDTFRAYRNHKQCDPLVDPGLADLTADVDFASIRARLTGKCNVFGTATQRHFLTQLGIGLRLKKLLQVTNEAQQKELLSGVKMLVEDMGERFKFMVIFGENRPSLPVCFEL